MRFGCAADALRSRIRTAHRRCVMWQKDAQNSWGLGRTISCFHEPPFACVMVPSPFLPPKKSPAEHGSVDPFVLFSLYSVGWRFFPPCPSPDVRADRRSPIQKAPRLLPHVVIMWHYSMQGRRLILEEGQEHAPARYPLGSLCPRSLGGKWVRDGLVGCLRFGSRRAMVRGRSSRVPQIREPRPRKS